jgi:hypothetical protein
MNARVQTLCRMSTLLPTKGQSTKENPPCSHLSRGEMSPNPRPFGRQNWPLVSIFTAEKVTGRKPGNRFTKPRTSTDNVARLNIT